MAARKPPWPRPLLDDGRCSSVRPVSSQVPGPSNGWWPWAVRLRCGIAASIPASLADQRPCARARQPDHCAIQRGVACRKGPYHLASRSPAISTSPPGMRRRRASADRCRQRGDSAFSELMASAAATGARVIRLLSARIVYATVRAGFAPAAGAPPAIRPHTIWLTAR